MFVVRSWSLKNHLFTLTAICFSLLHSFILFLFIVGFCMCMRECVCLFVWIYWCCCWYFNSLTLNKLTEMKWNLKVNSKLIRINNTAVEEFYCGPERLRDFMKSCFDIKLKFYGNLKAIMMVMCLIQCVIENELQFFQISQSKWVHLFRFGEKFCL